MAAAIAGGFDVHFVEPLCARLTCPICQMAAREPRITDCGHHAVLSRVLETTDQTWKSNMPCLQNRAEKIGDLSKQHGKTRDSESENCLR